MIHWVFYVNGYLEFNKVKLFSNELLIYTDINKEDLEIRLMEWNKERSHLIKLIDVTHSFKAEYFLLESKIYSIILPDVEDGELLFKTKDSDGHSPKTFKCSIQADKNPYKSLLTLSHPERLDSDLFVYEINFTMFLNDSKERTICVVSNTLDKKVSLDKSLEYLQFNICAKSVSCFENKLDRSQAYCVSFIRDLNPKKKKKKLLEIFNSSVSKNRVCLNIIYKLSLINYKSLKYESSILNEGIKSPKDFIFALFNTLFTDDGEKLRLTNSFCKLKKSLKKKKYKKRLHLLERPLRDVESALLKIKKFFDKKESMDKNYIKLRDSKFRETYEQKDVSARIMILKNNLVALESFFAVKFLFEICSLYSYCIEESNKPFRKEDRKYLSTTQEIEKYHKIKVNYECLFTKDFEKYFDKLKNDETFKRFKSDKILKDLKESRNYIRRLLNNGERYCDYLLSLTDKAISYWQKICNDKTEVGFECKD